MLRGLEELFGGVRPITAGGPAGRKRGEGERRRKPPLAIEQPFPEAWAAYCAANPRLRDPRVLSALIRRDLPSELRREVWSHCLGIDPGEVSGQVPATELAELPEGADQLIEADLSRTFPNSEEFQAAGGTEALRRMLRRIAVVDPDLGYCQSMNFLAAVLLMVLLNEGAAILAVQTLLVKLGTRGWYVDCMRQLRADTSVLEDLLRERLPGVLSTFKAHNFELLFITSKWFLALFATTLEGETLRRVWDVVINDGIEAVFRVAFALLHRQAEEVLRAGDIDELVILFHGMQSDWSPEELLKAAYGPAIGQINRAELAQKRKEKVAKISSTDMRAEIRNVIIWRGGVRPGSALARTSREAS